MTERALTTRQIQWLVVGHWLIVLPHIQPLPAWIILLSVLTGCWRLAAVAGYARVPPWPLRLLLALGSVLGVVIAFGTLKIGRAHV